MPFIIKVATPWGERLGARDKFAVTSRHAVATIEKAREAVRDHVVSAGIAHGTTPDPITNNGGTVGPLPDGCIIDVQRVQWDELALQAGLTYPAIVGGYAEREPLGNSARQILEAFNAQ